MKPGDVLTCGVCGMQHTVTRAQAKPVRKGQTLTMLCDGPGIRELRKLSPLEAEHLNANGRHAPEVLNP